MSHVPGFLYAYQFDDKGQHEAAAENTDFAAITHSQSSWFWLHLNLADQRCRRWLLQALNLPSGLVEEFLTASSRQYVTQSEAYVTGYLNDFHHVFEVESHEQAFLSFILHPNFILTGRIKPVQSAQNMRKQLELNFKPQSPAQLLASLIANYPDTLDKLQNKFMDELEYIEDQVLDNRQRGERQRLMLARRHIAYLHRHTRSLRRALTVGERSCAAFPPSLSLTVQRLTHLDQDFDVMEQRARFFHDEIDAKLAAETNRQLYVLSVLTALFLPPTLVAGLFGMNVQGIPASDIPDGFLVALIISLLSSLVVGLVLWRINKR